MTREEVYADLRNQLEREEPSNRHSARVILGLLSAHIQPKSVLDVGCGLGTWLDVAREMWGCEIQGVDGEWTEGLRIDKSLVHRCDLEKDEVDFRRTFDLAICLETGEHLSPKAAPKLVETLTKHSDYVLWSAAIPGQGGHDHRNEQFLPYWENLFGKHKFHVLDPFRRKVWNDENVLWWLRQNAVLFSEVWAMPVSLSHAMSIVHPDVYISRLVQRDQIIRQQQAEIEHLRASMVPGTMVWPGRG